MFTLAETARRIGVKLRHYQKTIRGHYSEVCQLQVAVWVHRRRSTKRRVDPKSASMIPSKRKFSVSPLLYRFLPGGAAWQTICVRHSGKTRFDPPNGFWPVRLCMAILSWETHIAILVTKARRLVLLLRELNRAFLSAKDFITCF